MLTSMASLASIALILIFAPVQGQQEVNACFDDEGNRRCASMGEPSKGCWFVDSPFMDADTGADCCPWEVCARDCFDEITDQYVISGARLVTTNEDGSTRDCTCVANRFNSDSSLKCN